MANYVKFKTNLAEVITFHFSQPKEYDGKFGKQYSYGVEWKGQDAYLSATETLHNKLQAIGNLKDTTLRITKIEGDNNRKFWQIQDIEGQDITPEITPQAQNSRQSDFQAGYGVQPIPRENPHSHDDLTREINQLKFAVHALWAVLISGDEEKEKSYEMHKIKVL